VKTSENTANVVEAWNLQILEKTQKRINQVLANKKNASQVLEECYHALAQIKSGAPGMDIYSRGRLNAHIWELEQMFGHKGPYLSAAGQDKFIHETFFKGKKTGTFVEIGGYNGWRGSNCYFFEKTLGWRGVIVEASPTLVKGIGDYRSVPVIHAAVSNKDGSAEFMDVVSGATQMGGLAEHYIGARLGDVRTQPGHAERRVSVPTITLAGLLAGLKVKHVDYISLDVEGAERSILEAFNFKDFEVDVFSVENPTCTDATSVKDILEPAGYRLAEVVGSDEIYVRTGSGL
jgi:FkbM family methyltransferase